MNRELITLENVSVVYNTGLPFFRRREPHCALKNISFKIRQGESIGVIGNNGAGKTTLLRTLADIIQPDSGNIINRGATTHLLSLQLGFDPNLTGRQNAIMSGMLIGLDHQEVVRILPQIQNFSELGDYFYKPLNTYSAGMIARLGFGVASHAHCDVLLIDEILAVGDARFREKSKSVMSKKLLSGDTVLLVTHNLKDIKEFCNRAIWIDNGEIKNIGLPAEVVQEYVQAQSALRN